MGYAGITSDYDVQAASDDYFAYASILQIQTNLATKTCPVSTVLVIILHDKCELDYVIPNGTAFILKERDQIQKGILSAIPGSKMIVQ
jgi:hypothetical protein